MVRASAVDLAEDALYAALKRYERATRGRIERSVTLYLIGPHHPHRTRGGALVLRRDHLATLKVWLQRRPIPVAESEGIAEDYCKLSRDEISR